jgi:uroporphyrinogen III methyltransferase/synthase
VVDVGKSPGAPVHQDDISALLVERGRAGLCVVRLKGGDPFVFGRGGEEALALRQAGVAFEIVPGVTSAVAVPAYAGVPVTHRGTSTSFSVVTGHSRNTEDTDTNWEALAAAGGTIVVLMGVAHRDEIARRLMAGGLAPETAVLAVHWGTRPEQTSVRTTLGGLGTVALQPPATIVVGPVAAVDAGWYEHLPLFGRRVIVTGPRRPREATPTGFPAEADLSAHLREMGARPVDLPAIRIGPPADGARGLRAAAAALAEGRYRWVVFTSANAVGPMLAHVPDARAFAGCQIAAIGAGTAAALKSQGLVADLVPQRYVAEGLLDVFPAAPAGGGGAPDGTVRGAGAGAGVAPEAPEGTVRGAGAGAGVAPEAPEGTVRGAGAVLLPRAAVARDVLPDGLVARGWQVDVVEAYRTEPADPPPHALDAVSGADAVCFTSASTVTAFVAMVGAGAVPPVVACIGPVTAAAARAAGLAVTVVAEQHTGAGVARALCAVFTPPKGNGAL